MDLVQILAECTCDENLRPIVNFLHHGLLPIIQIGIPIILIVMGSIDLGKAVLSSDDKEIKGATNKLIKRAIAAVAVFFVGTIVALLMGMFSKQGVKSDRVEGTSCWQKCWDD